MTKGKHYTDLKIKVHKLKLLIRSCHCQRRVPVNNRVVWSVGQFWSVGH